MVQSGVGRLGVVEGEELEIAQSREVGQTGVGPRDSGPVQLLNMSEGAFARVFRPWNRRPKGTADSLPSEGKESETIVDRARESVCVGADHLIALGARECHVGQRIDRILDEFHAAVALPDADPAGVTASCG